MSRPRVLVVDDDAAFRNLLVSLLRKDFIVFVAPDGAEGFQKASETPPDLTIIDVQMPKWDGLQTLRAFRSHPLLRRVPVVMLTADASRETVIAAIQAGANDYIIKTAFTKEDLCRKIRRALDAAAAAEGGGPAVIAPPAPAKVAPVAASPERPMPPARANGPARPQAEMPPSAVDATPDSDAEIPVTVPPPGRDLQAVLDSWE